MIAKELSEQELEELRGEDLQKVFTPGERIPVNGVTMQVVNVAKQSILLKPDEPLTWFAKGRAFNLKKFDGLRYLLRPLGGRD